MEVIGSMLDVMISTARYCRRLRRRWYEAAGQACYSMPASHDLDRKLEKYLDYRGGFFIEAGANDGYLQSNTYYLEKMKGWRGILIEPVPELFAQCRKERGGAVVVNAALVSPEYAEAEITIHYFNAMTYTEGAFSSREEERKHRQEAGRMQRRKRTYAQRVPARTLTAILSELKTASPIDFLSLDLEGYEVQALKGLDLATYRPAYMLIEGNDIEGVRQAVAGAYVEVEQLSERDYLFRSIK